ncbi:SMI1/KNR4 family protein [Agrobacterium rosae]
MSDDLTQLFDRSNVTRTASAEEISAVEAHIGVLPPSYKAFAETFGYGTTNGLFVIEMPFNMFGSDGLLVRGRVLHEQVHWLVDQLLEDGCGVGDPDCLEPYDEESCDIAIFFEDLRFYGNSINGQYLGWRRDQDGSFKFYVIDRACLSIRFVGTSLIEFIRRTQTDEVKTLLGSGYDALPSTFEGATGD